LFFSKLACEKWQQAANAQYEVLADYMQMLNSSPIVFKSLSEIVSFFSLVFRVRKYLHLEVDLCSFSDRQSRSDEFNIGRTKKGYAFAIQRIEGVQFASRPKVLCSKRLKVILATCPPKCSGQATNSNAREKSSRTTESVSPALPFADF